MGGATFGMWRDFAAGAVEVAGLSLADDLLGVAAGGAGGTPFCFFAGEVATTSFARETSAAGTGRLGGLTGMASSSSTSAPSPTSSSSESSASSSSEASTTSCSFDPHW